jgi:hypothetical protein
MVQPQLTDYISSQLKLGVSRDAIKSALKGAGWLEVDVEDTLKTTASVAAAATPVSGMGAGSSIKVSDLVSASSSATSFFSTSPSSPSSLSKSAPKDQPKDQKSQSMGSVATKASPKTSTVFSAGDIKKSDGMVMKVALIAATLLFAGLAGFLYYKNMTLSSETAKLKGQGGDVSSRIAALTTQLQALKALSTASDAQVAMLNAQNATLAANLSFAAEPPSPTPLPQETISISGILSYSSLAYQLVTPYGVMAVVQNSSDAKVIAALKPLLTGTNPVTLTGTHIPGSQFLTVTAVNGTSLSAAPATSVPTTPRAGGR